jgi:TRAP-type C4-dicarboxylate transport system permease small subunit
MTLVVTLQIICRYLLGASLTWSEELARYLLVWITFLGAGIAFRRGAHMGFNLLLRSMAPKFRSLARMITSVGILTFLSIATWKGTQLAIFNMGQHSPAMGLPIGVAYLAIPTGCLIMAVHAVGELNHFFSTWRAARSGRTG